MQFLSEPHWTERKELWDAEPVFFKNVYVLFILDFSINLIIFLYTGYVLKYFKIKV